MTIREAWAQAKVLWADITDWNRGFICGVVVVLLLTLLVKVIR